MLRPCARALDATTCTELAPPSRHRRPPTARKSWRADRRETAAGRRGEVGGTFARRRAADGGRVAATTVGRRDVGTHESADSMASAVEKRAAENNLASSSVFSPFTVRALTDPLTFSDFLKKSGVTTRVGPP